MFLYPRCFKIYGVLKGGAVGVDNDVLVVVGLKLVQLNEQDAPLVAEGRMAKPLGIAKISARREVAGFV